MCLSFSDQPHEVLTHMDQSRELEQNHSRAVGFIQEAATAGANLAVLPEYHLRDFDPDDENFGRQCAHWKKYLDAYCALAKKCHICIVPGSFAELHRNEETQEERLVNCTYFIDYNGDILGRYEKKNLWHPERPIVTGSIHDAHPCFDTPLGKVGMLICWDLAFPEAFKELIAQGAKLIIVPAFWKLTDASDVGMKRNPLSDQVFIDATVVSRAFENTCAVVFCNVAGPAAEGYMGHSQVAVPFMGCLEKFSTSEEGMKIVEVDMDIVEEAESVYKIREDMGKQNWHYMYRHIRSR